MSKAVLISIRPKWCELIANGNKTIEIRKTRPQIKTPFKCYIYCTSNGRPLVYGDKPCSNGWAEAYTQTYGYNREEADKIWNVMNGKVIGEFVCDTIIKDNTCGRDDLFNGAACLTQVTATGYASGKPIYGWHISALKIYDTPRMLSEFRSYNTLVDFEQGYPMPTHGIRRPPQSYMYVEELP